MALQRTTTGPQLGHRVRPVDKRQPHRPTTTATVIAGVTVGSGRQKELILQQLALARRDGLRHSCLAFAWRVGTDERVGAGGEPEPGRDAVDEDFGLLVEALVIHCGGAQ